MVLDYVPPPTLVFAVVFLLEGIIAIHAIGYEIARRRSHPYQDPVYVAGWIGPVGLPHEVP